MPFIPVADTCEVAFHYQTGFGEPMVNTFHVEIPGGYGSSDLEGVCELFRDWWNGTTVGVYVPLQDFQSSAVVLESITARSMAAATDPTFELSVNAAGGDATEVMPYQLAIVASWKTGFSGRSFRGRTYLGGITQQYNDGGAVTAAGVAALQITMQTLIDQVEAVATQQLVVVSKYSGGAPRAAGVTTPITSVTIDNVWDTQRRRSHG